MATADEYRQRADACRWLAELITARGDPVIAALLKLAADYEAKAAAIEAGAPLVERDGLILVADLASSPHGDDVAGLAGDQRLDVRRPEVERASFLGTVTGAVVDVGHTSLMAAEVVQDGLDDVG
jgi:hypothetical protein